MPTFLPPRGIPQYGNHGQFDQPADSIYAGNDPEMESLGGSNVADDNASFRHAKALAAVQGMDPNSGEGSTTNIDLNQRNGQPLQPRISRKSREAMYSQLPQDMAGQALTQARGVATTLNQDDQPMTASFGGQNFVGAPRARISDQGVQGVINQYLQQKLKADAHAEQDRTWGHDKEVAATMQGNQVALAQIPGQNELAKTKALAEIENTRYTRDHPADVMQAENAGKIAAAHATTAEAQTRAEGKLTPQEALASRGQLGEAMVKRGTPESLDAAGKLYATTPGLDAATADIAKSAFTPAYEATTSKLQPDIDAMVQEVGSHTTRYGYAEQARTQAAKDDIIAKATAMKMPADQVARLKQELDAKERQILSKNKPYKSALGATVDTLTGGLAGATGAVGSY